MKINQTTFFAYLRKSPFGGRLTQAQIDGVNAVMGQCEDHRVSDLRHIAYILATAFHETGGKMQPVREGFASSDAKARKIVAARKYSVEDFTTKQVYYGRGLVQLTWADNYKKMGDALGLDLYEDPDIALRADVSAEILVYGMVAGSFTGKRLKDYFSGTVEDPKAARRIINGTDKAALIATYYEQFLSALKAAECSTPQPTDVVASDAKADAPALATDKTVLGTITSVLGAGGAGVFAAVNNPWALGAVVVVLLGVVLFLSGRLEIRRKAGA